MNINFAFTVLELAHLSIATTTASKKRKLWQLSIKVSKISIISTLCGSNITELIANDENPSQSQTFIKFRNRVHFSPTASI